MNVSALVPEPVSRDLVKFFEEALESARAGHAKGFVGGILLKRRRFFVACIGDAAKDPVFARGICCALDDELQRMSNGQAGPETVV